MKVEAKEKSKSKQRKSEGKRDKSERSGDCLSLTGGGWLELQKRGRLASSRRTKQSGGKACQKNLRNTSYKFREIHVTELDKYT